jgi:hypothetical protein
MCAWSLVLPALKFLLPLPRLVRLVTPRRRTRARDRERERRVLLQRAVDASDAERRRIAASLHDGPVQSLAGMAFGLEAAAERARGSDGLGATLHDAARRARETMRELDRAPLQRVLLPLTGHRVVTARRRAHEPRRALHLADRRLVARGLQEVDGRLPLDGLDELAARARESLGVRAG